MSEYDIERELIAAIVGRPPDYVSCNSMIWDQWNREGVLVYRHTQGFHNDGIWHFDSMNHGSPYRYANGAFDVIVDAIRKHLKRRRSTKVVYGRV